MTPRTCPSAETIEGWVQQALADRLTDKLSPELSIRVVNSDEITELNETLSPKVRPYQCIVLSL